MTETLIAEHDLVPRVLPDRESEKNPRQEAKKRYYEALRPDEETAEKIRSIVNETLQGALTADPTLKHKQVLDIGAGIFFWEQRLHDTGTSLPVGMTYHTENGESLPRYGKNERDIIGFDTRVFSYGNYAYVTDLLRRQGVLEKVADLQETYRKEHKGEILAAMENVLRESPLMDYLDSFKAKEPEEEAQEDQPIQPDSDHWQDEKIHLERRFISDWGQLPGSNREPDPMLDAAYLQDVEQRLRRLREPIESGTQGTDSARELFRRRVEAYMREKTKFSESELREELQKLRAEKIEEELTGTITERYSGKLQNALREFAWDEILPLNDDVHFWNIAQPVKTLQRLVPYLYDIDDTRDFETVMNAALPVVAEAVFDLTNSVFLWGNDYGSRDLAWQTEAIGPIEQGIKFEDWHEHSGGLQNGWRNLKRDYGAYGSYKPPGLNDADDLPVFRRSDAPAPQRTTRNPLKWAVWYARDIGEGLRGLGSDREDIDPLDPENQAKEGIIHTADSKETDRKKRQHLGEVKFAQPEVFANVQQRLVVRTARDPLVYNIQSEDEVFAYAQVADAVIDVKDPRLGNYDEDPLIEGMQLIARDPGYDRYFYKIDSESTVHERIEKKLRRDQREKLVKLCNSIGMNELAKQIEDAVDPSIGDFIDFARPFMVGYIPKRGGRRFEVNTLQDFVTNGCIDTKGQLRGVCDTFERFMHLMLAEIEGKSSVIRVVGLSFHNSEFIDTQLHGKTAYRDKETGKVYWVDMEPDPSRSEIFTEEYERRIVKDPNETVILKPNEQVIEVPEPDPAPPALEEEYKKEKTKKEVASSVELFEKMLAEYLGEVDFTGVFANVDELSAFTKQIHHHTKGDLHKGPAVWSRIPHILIYSLVLSYEEWRLSNEGERGSFSLSERQKEMARRISSEIRFKGTTGANNSKNLQYSPQFMKVMERVVSSLDALSEESDVNEEIAA